jgi:uncharacterized phage protein (TIGR01671 family)
MRDFKFRKWDGNEMSETFCMGSVLSECIAGDDIVMQYTGEKDRKGKEIYEYDIINVFDKEEDENFNVYMRNCVVKYNDAMFSTQPVIGSKRGDYYISVGTLEDEELECEVIGNIYENPDLVQPPIKDVQTTT